jgi:YqaJ-like viral recombinase domain
MPFHDVQQRTPEHDALRLGRVTASRVADIIAKGKNGEPSAGRKNYMAELVIERLTGKLTTHSFTTRPIEHGVEKEPEARRLYAFMTGNTVTNGGFYVHDRIEMAGASPDGNVGDDGLTEFKAPNSASHIESLRKKPVSGRYQTQMQWQFSSSNRQWCDHVSFDPDFPVEMKLAITRTWRDPATIVKLEQEVRLFLEELDASVYDLKRRFAA